MREQRDDKEEMVEKRHKRVGIEAKLENIQTHKRKKICLTRTTRFSSKRDFPNLEKFRISKMSTTIVSRIKVLTCSKSSKLLIGESCFPPLIYENEIVLAS